MLKSSKRLGSFIAGESTAMIIFTILMVASNKYRGRYQWGPRSLFGAPHHRHHHCLYCRSPISQSNFLTGDGQDRVKEFATHSSTYN